MNETSRDLVRIGTFSRLGIFLLIAYTISWAAWIILYAQRLPPFAGPGRRLYVLAVLAPHAAALVTTALKNGRAEIPAFYRRVIRPIPIQWVFIAIGLPPLIYLIRDTVALGLHLAHGAFFHNPPRSLNALVFGQLIVVSGEEPGWRGFALPRLVARYGAIVGTLAIGIVWTGWHLPLFIIPGTPQHGTSLLGFAILLIAWSMVITFIMVHARGSIIPAMLFHASANIAAFTMWEPDNQLFALFPWVIAAAIAAWRMKSVSRNAIDPGAIA